MHVFKRYTGDDPMRKGEWRLWQQHDAVRVVVCCPDCGEVAELDHEVSANGTVSPSLDCPNMRCKFHESGRLEDWVEKGPD
jgi:hypothetical protein